MKETTRKRHSGFGQLTLVEHSLCPLDHNSSLVENLVHESQYGYSDSRRKRQTAQARVFCPLGLSASDELYLWGLLALTLSQPEGRSDLVATPHWCLKHLGMVDSSQRRGGAQYQRFRNALRRLSAISYICDAFYDPVRAEHRSVNFHFFSYNLPIDSSSNRAWRLSWDETFLEFAKHGSGYLRFDLEIYRLLDPASRRLFLFVSKIFYRRATLPQLSLQYLAVDVLGFSDKVAAKDLRIKIKRCLKRLEQIGVVAGADVTRVAAGRYVVNARRGVYFDRDRASAAQQQNLQPVIETLVGIGFEIGAAYSLTRKYPATLLEQWADITQAATERFGQKFFKKSPMAFFVNSVSKAHAGKRTPPDWWRSIRREEGNANASVASKKLLNDISIELFGENSEMESAANPSSTMGISDILKSVS